MCHFYYFVLTGKVFLVASGVMTMTTARESAREKHGNRMRENVILSPTGTLRKIHHWNENDDSKFTKFFHPPPPTSSSQFTSCHHHSHHRQCFPFLVFFLQMKMLIFIRMLLTFSSPLRKAKETFFSGAKLKKSLLHSLYLKVFLLITLRV